MACATHQPTHPHLGGLLALAGLLIRALILCFLLVCDLKGLLILQIVLLLLDVHLVVVRISHGADQWQVMRLCDDASSAVTAAAAAAAAALHLRAARCATAAATLSAYGEGATGGAAVPFHNNGSTWFWWPVQKHG
jgi:hypothetical protein